MSATKENRKRREPEHDLFGEPVKEPLRARWVDASSARPGKFAIFVLQKGSATLRFEVAWFDTIGAAWQAFHSGTGKEKDDCREVLRVAVWRRGPRGLRK